MTKEEVKIFCDNLEVAKAWAYDNKPIQIRRKNYDDVWQDVHVDSPEFLSDEWEWRVKPEPREHWIHKGTYTREVVLGIQSCSVSCLSSCKPYKVREVMNEAK